MSAISFWEIAMLQAKGRVAVPEDVSLWRQEQLAQGIIELPVDGAIAARAGGLPDMHGDPADRIIVATVLGGHSLLTADERILSWSGPLDSQDARE